MCLFWRSPTAWSPESTSGDFIFNLAIAYSGKLEIGTRQLNNRRPHVPPDFLPICQPGALSTRLHCSRMPRHRTRPPGRYTGQSQRRGQSQRKASPRWGDAKRRRRQEEASPRGSIVKIGRRLAGRRQDKASPSRVSPRWNDTKAR